MAPVGSFVVMSGKVAEESKTYIENASGTLPAGELSLAVNENDNDVPMGLNVTSSSLKNDEPTSEKIHGPEPVTLPEVDVESGVPSDVSELSVTVLSGGPPSMKSKARTAATPLNDGLSMVTSIVVACAVAHDANSNAAIAVFAVPPTCQRVITLSETTTDSTTSVN